MEYFGEEEALEALGASSFRNLSKEKVMKLWNMFPGLDQATRMAAIEQVPQLARVAQGYFESIQQGHARTLGSNDRSQDRFYTSIDETRAAFVTALDRAESEEERARIANHLMELASIVATKDSENKEFLQDNFQVIATAGAIVIGVIGAVLLGKSPNGKHVASMMGRAAPKLGTGK